MMLLDPEEYPKEDMFSTAISVLNKIYKFLYVISIFLNACLCIIPCAIWTFLLVLTEIMIKTMKPFFRAAYIYIDWSIELVYKLFVKYFPAFGQVGRAISEYVSTIVL